MLMTTQFSEPVLAWLNGLDPDLLSDGHLTLGSNRSIESAFGVGSEAVDLVCKFTISLRVDAVPFEVAHGETCISESELQYTAINSVNVTLVKVAIAENKRSETRLEFDPSQDQSSQARWDDVFCGIVRKRETQVLEHFNAKCPPQKRN